MNWSHFVMFLGTAALVEMSPGPNFLLISKTVSFAGKRAAYANIAGFSLAFCLHGALSIGGISIILAQSPTAFSTIKWLGASYLCWIGVKALIEARSESSSLLPLAESQQQSIVAGFREGLITNTLNPKISLFYLAAFPQFVLGSSATAASSALLVLTHIVISASWFSIVIRVLEQLTNPVGNQRRVRWLKGFGGVALICIGATFMTAST